MKLGMKQGMKKFLRPDMGLERSRTFRVMLIPLILIFFVLFLSSCAPEKITCETDKECEDKNFSCEVKDITLDLNYREIKPEEVIALGFINAKDVCYKRECRCKGHIITKEPDIVKEPCTEENKLGDVVIDINGISTEESVNPCINLPLHKDDAIILLQDKGMKVDDMSYENGFWKASCCLETKGYIDWTIKVDSNSGKISVKHSGSLQFRN